MLSLFMYRDTGSAGWNLDSILSNQGTEPFPDEYRVMYSYTFALVLLMSEVCCTSDAPGNWMRLRTGFRAFGHEVFVCGVQARSPKPKA